MEKLSQKILKLDLNDLRKLNNEIVSLIKIKRKEESVDLINEFSVGDSVSFESKKNGKVYGKIVKIKRVKIDVETNLGVYAVPVMMLKKSSKESDEEKIEKTKVKGRLTKKDFKNGPIKAIIKYGEVFTNIKWSGKEEVELIWDNKENELSCNDGGHGYSHYDDGIYVRYEGSEHVMKIIKLIG